MIYPKWAYILIFTYFIFSQMDNAVEINAIEQEAALKIELMKTLISNLKKEAKRFLTLLAKYSSQKFSDGVLSKMPSDQAYQDIEQYCDLISKQVCGKIEEVNDKATRMKIDIGKLSNEIRTRP